MKKATLVIALFSMAHFGFTQSAISVAKSGNGNPLIFLPGFTSPGTVWDETIKHLEGSYESHLISYAGFNGLTPIDTPWYGTIKKQLADYIRNENLSDVTIIGHSMGGNLAIELASELPSKVTGLILVESIPCLRALMMPGVPADSLQYNSPYNNTILVMPAENFKKMARTISQNMTNTSSKVDLITDWAIAADRKTYVYGYTELLKSDLRDRLSTINIPTLVLGASFSGKEATKSNYEQQYLNLKNKKVLIADSSKHFIMFDQPEWLYLQINNYLKQMTETQKVPPNIKALNKKRLFTQI